jgi:ZIP family zinc transporter
MSTGRRRGRRPGNQRDVLDAVVLGIVVSSPLVLGGALGAEWAPPRWLTGVLLAFASGALISALCFELFTEAYELGGASRAGLGLLAGALTFVAANAAVDRWAAGSAEAEQPDKVHSAAGGGVGFALLAAEILDGVPENLALGTTLVEGAGESLALVVAIFAANFPEALVGGAAMRESGRSRGFIVGLWAVCAVILVLAVVAGYLSMNTVSDGVLAFFSAFAGGAVLASLADTLMPEAFEHGRPLNVVGTSAGFFLAFVLSAG